MSNFSRYLVLVSLLSRAVALSGLLPTETPISQFDALGVFVPQVTDAPSVPLVLHRRDEVNTALVAPNNTCGFLDGSSVVPYKCFNPTDSCVVFIPTATTRHGLIGCCSKVDANCRARYSCIDSTQFYDDSKCDQACKSDSGIVKCTEAAKPHCNSVTFAGLDVMDWYCDSSAANDFQTILTAITSSPYATRVDTTSTSIGLLGGSLSSKTSSSQHLSTYPSASGSFVPSGSSSTANDTSSSTSSTAPFAAVTATQTPATARNTPLGVIVGSTVGALAAAGLLGASLICWRRRRVQNPQVRLP